MLMFQDPLASLSADMIARTYNIFSIILKYAVDMLTWDKENELPPGLEPPYVHTHTPHHPRWCYLYVLLFFISINSDMITGTIFSLFKFFFAVVVF